MVLFDLLNSKKIANTENKRGGYEFCCLKIIINSSTRHLGNAKECEKFVNVNSNKCSPKQVDWKLNVTRFRAV